MKLSNGIVLFEVPSIRRVLSREQISIWDRWIIALRSNRYPQTKADLKNKSGYCCYGVLAEILIGDEILDDWITTKFGVSIIIEGGVNYVSTLPLRVLKHIGLLVQYNDGHVDREYRVTDIYGRSYTIRDLNTVGVGFPEIAKILEIAIEDGYKRKTMFA
jgi:hypothetical protein